MHVNAKHIQIRKHDFFYFSFLISSPPWQNRIALSLSSPRSLLLVVLWCCWWVWVSGLSTAHQGIINQNMAPLTLISLLNNLCVFFSVFSEFSKWISNFFFLRHNNIVKKNHGPGVTYVCMNLRTTSSVGNFFLYNI